MACLDKVILDHFYQLALDIENGKDRSRGIVRLYSIVVVGLKGFGYLWWREKIRGDEYSRS